MDPNNLWIEIKNRPRSVFNLRSCSVYLRLFRSLDGPWDDVAFDEEGEGEEERVEGDEVDSIGAPELESEEWNDDEGREEADGETDEEEELDGREVDLQRKTQDVFDHNYTAPILTISCALGAHIHLGNA